MLTIRRSNDRGHADHGWLDSRHTFSFGSYHDPAHMGFRVLRVMNEDRVAPSQGFDTHGHRDMEIVTYVLEGSLRHRDSLGTTETLKAGELQRMSAGTGILHSEFNASSVEPVHFYQIWIRPRAAGAAPSYEQKAFASADRVNRFQLVVSSDGAEGSLRIGQDAKLWLADMEPGRSLALPTSAGGHAWLQVLRGTIAIEGDTLATGDGAAISGMADAQVTAKAMSEVMVIELP
jgi:redox-sensitive bicupin YhaK (pirin superfamily)